MFSFLGCRLSAISHQSDFPSTQAACGLAGQWWRRKPRVGLRDNANSHSSPDSSVSSVSRSSSQKCAQKIPTINTRAENICHCQRPSRARTLNSHKKVPRMIIKLATFSIFLTMYAWSLLRFVTQRFLVMFRLGWKILMFLASPVNVN